MTRKKRTTEASKGKTSTTSTTTGSQNSSTNVTSDTKQSSDTSTNNKENLEPKGKKTPPKRRGVKIHNGGRAKKKLQRERPTKSLCMSKDMPSMMTL